MGYPYCPPGNATDFIDARRLSQLLSDTGTPVPVANVGASSLLNTHLLLASNRIDGSLLEARRYTAAELSAFADTDQGVVLRELCCDLAFGTILKRRRLTQPEWADLAESYQEALQRLELYRTGKLVLPLSDSKLDAGLPALVELGSGNNDPVLTTQRPWGVVDLSPVGPTDPQRNWASLDGGEERGDR